MGKIVLLAFTLALTAAQTDAQTTSATQPTAGRAARIAGHPNLNGLWQAMTEANWDITPHPARPGPAQFGALFSEPAGVGIVDGNEIPYQPWAAEKQKENFKNRWTTDPEAKCYMPGVPRAS